MEYAEIEGVEKPVSRLFFGTCTRDMKAGKNVNDLLDRAFELGINAFDTARCYGDAEKSLGMWLPQETTAIKWCCRRKAR